MNERQILGIPSKALNDRNYGEIGGKTAGLMGEALRLFVIILWTQFGKTTVRVDTPFSNQWNVSLMRASGMRSPICRSSGRRPEL